MKIPYLPSSVNLLATRLKQAFAVLCMAIFAVLLPAKLFAQAPIISYHSPNIYETGTAITPLAPTGSAGAVAAPGYSSTTVTIGSGFSYPGGVAADAAGNVYVADAGNDAVKEIPAGGAPPIIIGSGFNKPQGVAVDAAGNVYVADTGNGVVTKVPAGGGVPVIFGYGFDQPSGIAIDAAGNVYVADGGNNNITKITTDGTQSIIGAGLNEPDGVAVGAMGDVYVADAGSGTVKEIPVGGGALITIGSGFNAPTGVAVDAAGNVYVADYGNGALKEIPIGSGTPITIGSGFEAPGGVAVNGAGNVYATDSGNGFVEEIKPVGGYYISAALPAGLSFNNSTGIISGMPTAASAATNYTVTAYNASGSAQATTNIKVLSNNAGLSQLTLSSGIISPSFVSGTTSYSVPLSNTTKSITVTPTATDVLAVVKVNGSIVPRGSASAGLPLSLGANTITIIVTSSDGTVTRTYTISATLVAVPIISYSSPHTYEAGTAITPLAPTSNGGAVAAPVYSSTAVTLDPRFGNLGGIAIDAAGNVYVADEGNNTVTKIPAGGGTLVTLGSGFNSPAGLAADAAGNVYVADGGNNAVKKIPIGGGPTIAIGSGFNQPAGVTVDAAGNVYVADGGNNAVKKIPTGGGTPITIGSGFDQPTGVAVDAAGNVYVADFMNNAVKEIPVGGGAPITIGSGFVGPNGVAVDAAGNVFVADGSTDAVYEVPMGGGAAITIGSGFSQPTGVAVDGAGNVYEADGTGVVNKINLVGSYNIAPLLPAGLIFNNSTGIISGTATAASAATNYTVTAYNLSGSAQATTNIKVLSNNADLSQLTSSSGILSPSFVSGTTSYAVPLSNTTTSITVTPTATDVLAVVKVNGSIVPRGSASAGLPLSLGANTITIIVTSSDGTITKTYTITATLVAVPIISYSSPHTYEAGTAITPLAPTINGGAVAAPGYSSTVIAVGSGFNEPDGVAVDAAGNVYVADEGNNTVTKMPAGGGVVVTLGSGFNSPAGVAVDAAGNVYVADVGNTKVKKIPIGGGPTITIGSGFSQPDGVAVDAAGNVYVADAGNSAVYEVPIGGGPAITIGSGFSQPYGVAVDAAGNVYVADLGNSAVYKVPIGGGAPIAIGSGFNGPTCVAVDAMGDVYVADAGSAVKEIPVGGGALIGIASGLNQPIGVAVDAAGNVYVADTDDGLVKEIKPAGGYYISAALPAGLSFNNSTGIISGTATAAGAAINYTVTAYNVSGSAQATTNIKVVANIATLSKLTISSGTLTPAFATATTSYTDVAHSVSSIAFRATTTDPLATETINGTAVAEGAVSPYIPLNAGVNNITIVVTAQDGVTKDTYTIAVTRLPEVATLSKLTTSSGTLTPAFATATTSYTDVAHSVSSIAFRATTTDPLATETINGTAVPEGTVSYYVPLNAGVNNISIVVTAQDGVTMDTYTVAVTRLPEIATLSKLTISSGTLSPAFATGTTSYTDVAHSVSSIAFRATTTDPLATETINGTAVPEGTVSFYTPLSVGVNNISIVVTAQDGVTMDTYTVAVTRLPEIATLSKLTVSSGTLSPVFAAATTSYTDVAHSVSSIAFRATTTDPLATETINGTAVPEGTVSFYTPLNVGSNTITIIVTAQDGVTTDTYTVVVTRLPEIATLSGLTISSGTLSPAFATATTSYTDNVANTISSIAFRATTTDASATETINGTAVPEGTVSPYFPLNVGANTITIIVTAQDGVTTETYTIAVTRAAPPGANIVYEPISVETTTETPQLANDGIMVHQGVSPNGDGINDFLTIDNITNYPDNKLMIIDRNGMLVYETKGYDNASRVFDGHSNKNGAMQLPGTYFYSLDYTVNGITRHKTGFLVLKY